MSAYTRFDLSVYTIFSILLSGVILIFLFVYPKPDGFLFDISRLLIIVLVSYLFYQLYTEKWKRGLTGGSEKSSYRSVSSTKAILTEEEENEPNLALQSIIQLFHSCYPQLQPCLYLLDNSGTKLVKKCAVNTDSDFRAVLPVKDENISQLMSEELPGFLTPSENEEMLKEFFEEGSAVAESTSVFVSPIWMENDIIGLLSIQASQFSDFDEQHPVIISDYSNLIGQQLGQVRKESELWSDIHFYSRLNSFQNDLDLTLSQEELVSSIIELCKTSFTFDNLTISLVDETHPGEARILATSGFSNDLGNEARFKIADSLHGALIASGEVLRIDNLLEYNTGGKGRFSAGDMEEKRILSFLGYPIKKAGRTVGALVLESSSPNKYSENDEEALRIVSQRFGTLLEWWQTFEMVKESAIRDGLTGLLNHSSFVERFEEELNRARRYQTSLVLLILDLDKFKRINDTYGHLAGDYVLMETASRLKANVRNIDIVARYGGEEFAIILLNATKENIQSTAERIVASVSAKEFTQDETVVQMAISGGMAEFPVDGETIRDLIAKADEAMYQVKRQGGNGVKAYDSASAPS